MIREKKVSIRNKWEYLVPLLATASLLISCTIVSSKKFFWNDELLSFYLLSDPSFTRMMVAWGDKFNQAPPLYFMLEWLWAKVFNATELSLRLFSSLAICVTFTLVWITLRRTYNFWAASIGTLSVFCLSELILYHNAEVRMYGLFSAVCAFGLLQFDVINKRQKCSIKVLAVNTLIHATIVLTHLYGILYSGAIICAFVIRDRYFKVFRANVYLSVILGWFFLIPFIGSILNQADNYAKWFSTVSGSELLNYFIFSTKFPLLILALLIVSVFLYINQSPDRQTFETSNDNSYLINEISLLILAGTFFAVPILAWIITISIKPMLNSRYIIPTTTISWAILFAYLSFRILPNFTLSHKNNERLISKKIITKQRLILLMLTVILLIYPIYYAKKVGYYSQKPGINDDSYGYIELPFAMEAGHDFLTRFHYSPKRNRYFHILNWETALNITSSSFATGDYKHLEALKRNHPFLNSIQSKEFIDKYARFLVLNEEDQKWFETRIKNNPKYKVKLLGTTEGAWGPLDVLLVESKK